MRKIEKEMLAAIAHGKDWGKANTEVVTVKGFNMHLSGVYLHNNHIANVTVGAKRGYKVTPNVDTLRDYPTRTTMSRLRALGVDVCTRRGEVLLDGVAI